MKKQKKSTSLINLISEQDSTVADTAIAFYHTARSRHLDINKLVQEHFTSIKDNEKIK